jgi:hypothetical protein
MMLAEAGSRAGVDAYRGLALGGSSKCRRNRDRFMPQRLGLVYRAVLMPTITAVLPCPGPA